MEDPRQAVLRPSAPYQRSYTRTKEAWRKVADNNTEEEWIVPGEKPLRYFSPLNSGLATKFLVLCLFKIIFSFYRKRKMFLPVKLLQYNIPRDIRRCLLEHGDLGSIAHALREVHSLIGNSLHALLEIYKHDWSISYCSILLIKHTCVLIALKEKITISLWLTNS